MSTGTINGLPIGKCEIHIPAWGIPHADVTVNDGTVLVGAVSIVVADLTMTGFVVPNRGGVYRGLGTYRIVAGAGGWAKPIGAQEYRNDAGVTTSKVVGDAASLAGEKLAPMLSDPGLGVAFVRPAGPAALALQLVSERSWYVDAVGLTWLGARTPSVATQSFTLIDSFPGRARVTIAADEIASLVPGVEVEGLVAANVTHVLTKDTLRTIVWGAP